MKWTLYNLLFFFAYLVMMPLFLLRMKRRGGYRARMGDRFGRYPDEVRKRFGKGGRIWFHAVSVGEVQVACQLMDEMRKLDPEMRFVFSTTSSTGWKIAEQLLAADDVLIYNPLDFNGCVKRAIDAIRPRAVVIAETEIWPNFLRALKRRGVPVYLVNARVSDRSAPRYKALRWFFGETLKCFTKIYAQSRLDADRLLAAGADADRVEVAGSFKFDVAKRNPAKEQELRKWIGLGDVLLGGSTWPGEDEMMLRVYAKLVKTRPDVKLVIAPRHFEKADAVEANIVAAGFECIRRSTGAETKDGGVYLCDTTGEMMGLFGIASVAFVGKSLCAHGSQNMIEPCLCGVPTVVGPYTENFRPVMSDLLEADALVQTADVEGALLKFFAEPEYAGGYASRAKAAVEKRRGVVGRCAAELVKAFADLPVPSAERRLFWPICLAVLVVWGISGFFVTPRLEHAWKYLQMNPARSYVSFLSLSAATCFYPWCRKAAAKACSGIMTFEEPGVDEFGVDRYRATRLLRTLLPKLFPDCRAVVFDARFKSMADFRKVHLAMLEKGGYHLWCIGRRDFVFISSSDKPVKADRFFTAFSNHFEEFATAGLYAPAEVFSCYVGDDKAVGPALEGVTSLDSFLSDVLPMRLAFKPELSGGRAAVKPSFLISEAIPKLEWFVRGDADARVYFDFVDRVDNFQRARRDIVVAFDWVEAGGATATNALSVWAAAAKASPRDPLLANLADTLDLQGRRLIAIGNVNAAMQCYQNRLEVFPNDIAAVNNFAVCLKKGGHYNEAAQVFLTAAKKDPSNESPLRELVECALASKHEEDALKVVEILLKRHPNDRALKEKAAAVRAAIAKRNVKEHWK